MKASFFKVFTLIIIGLFLSCSDNDDNVDNNITNPEDLDFTGQAFGCGNFFVVQFLSDDNLNTVLWVEGSGRENLELTSEIQDFSLPNDNLNINIQLWDGPVNDLFCTDIALPNQPVLLNTWTAISGNLRVSVSNVETDETISLSTFYNVTNTLDNVLFENENGEQILIESLSIEDVSVCFFAG